MDTGNNNIPFAQVPGEDPAIETAMVQLEELLSRWEGAVAEANGAFENLSAHIEELKAAAEAPAPTTAAETETVQPAIPEPEASAAAEQEPVAEPVAEAPQEAQARPVDKSQLSPQEAIKARLSGVKSEAREGETPVKLPPSKAKEAPEEKASAQPPEKDKGGNGFSLKGLLGKGKEPGKTEEELPPQVKPEEPKGAEPEKSPVDEDEALLASLDPKLAKSIRIKRRLSNGRKSVRELLEEEQR